MASVEVTWMRAAKVYWSLTWRTGLYALLAGVALTAVWWRIDAAAAEDPAGLSSEILREDPLTLVALGALPGLVLGAIIGIVVVRTVLGITYSDFRIGLEPLTTERRRVRIEPRL